MKPPDWQPLPPRYLDPDGKTTPQTPAGASELLEDGFRGLGWVLGKLGKGLWWGGLGLGAVVLLFTDPVGSAVVVLLTAILWSLYKPERSEEN